jgi:hypothetical protein
MLDAALKYRVVVDDITANKALKLRAFELDDDDWAILKDLLRVLKVNLIYYMKPTLTPFQVVQGCHALLLEGCSGDNRPCHSNYGSN